MYLANFKTFRFGRPCDKPGDGKPRVTGVGEHVRRHDRDQPMSVVE